MTVEPFYVADLATVYAEDCLDVLRQLPDSSVHAVICDPPYGLAEIRTDDVVETLTAWLGGDREHIPARLRTGFMGRDWDRFVPPPAVWDECLRVLKPGGHLAAFAAPRTVDLMGLSIRLAGFEIRDGLQWIYGSGMPKGINVSKAIDKMRDDRTEVLQVTFWLADQAEAKGIARRQVDEHMGTSDMAGWWLSRILHRCQLPTWEQWERLRELIGFDNKLDAEVWRLNGRKGTPGEAWEQRAVIGQGYRVDRQTGAVPYGSGTPEGHYDLTAPATDEAARWEGWNTSLRPAHEPIIVARKPLVSTVAANVLAHGTGAINVDACRVATADQWSGTRRTALGITNDDGWQPKVTQSETHSAGRWPANVLLCHGESCEEDGPCVPGCPVAELDAQSGISSDRARVSGQRSAREAPVYGTPNTTRNAPDGYGDSGGASRFYPTFRYQAKAPGRERPKVNGVAHVSVKPLQLMKWLVRLLTPPGGTVVDPFAGSGTTIEAAMLEGFRVVGVEREQTYLPLIVQRIERARATLTERAQAEAQTAATPTTAPLFDVDVA